MARAVQPLIGPNPLVVADWTDFSSGWWQFSSSKTWLWRVKCRFSSSKVQATKTDWPTHIPAIFGRSSEFWDVAVSSRDLVVSSRDLAKNGLDLTKSSKISKDFGWFFIVFLLESHRFLDPDSTNLSATLWSSNPPDLIILLVGGRLRICPPDLVGLDVGWA